MNLIQRALAAGVVAVVVSLAAPSAAEASHSWGGYHWARTTPTFTLQLGDNLTTADWKSHLTQASGDWNNNTTSYSTVIQTTIVAGTSVGNCRAVAGTTQVCNKNYGFNGWLGLASIWVLGGHISQGTAKMNDSYFSTSTYNNPNERQHVVCQEVAHTFGLDHQSTDGSSRNTCMDYFSNTGANAGSTLSTKPNAHDFEELAIIYNHLDSTTTVKSMPAVAAPGAAPDGTPFGASPENGNYYIQDLGNGNFLLTHVFWAPRGR